MSSRRSKQNVLRIPDEEKPLARELLTRMRRPQANTAKPDDPTHRGRMLLVKAKRFLAFLDRFDRREDVLWKLDGLDEYEALRREAREALAGLFDENGKGAIANSALIDILLGTHHKPCVPAGVWPESEYPVQTCKGHAPELPEGSVTILLEEREHLRRGVDGLADWLDTSSLARHSLDFRFVHWYGTDYGFTSLQAPIVGLLWQAWENGTPDVGDDTLLVTVDAHASRLIDTFRDHPAWETMIQPGATRGSRRLVAPKI